MNGFRDRIACFTRAMFLLLTLCLAACSDLGPGGGKSDPISLANNGSQPLSIIVVELETGRRVEPILSFKATSSQRGLLQPGEVVSLTGQDIGGGYARGDGIMVFVYDVSDGVANCRSAIQLTFAQLKQRDFHVDVSTAFALSASSGVDAMMARGTLRKHAESGLSFALTQYAGDWYNAGEDTCI